MGTAQSSLLLVRDTQNKGLTANSGRFFSRFSSPPSRIVAREVRRTLEKTSSCWQAVDTLVISPWYPASEISCSTQTRSQRERERAVSRPAGSPPAVSAVRRASAVLRSHTFTPVPALPLTRPVAQITTLSSFLPVSHEGDKPGILSLFSFF